MQAVEFILEGLGIGELLSGMAVKPNERKECFSLSMLWLAVREAGKSAKPPPIGCARIGSVATSDSLSGESPERFGKDMRVLQPCLKVAGAGLDDGAWLEPIGGQCADLQCG